MNKPIFTLPRRGFLGQTPGGADYMPGVEARARMLAKACRIRRDDGNANIEQRQMALPFSTNKKD